MAAWPARLARSTWANLGATLLFRDQPIVVINPRMLHGKGRPRDLPRLAARTRDADWPNIAAALGWPDSAPTLTFETRALAVQAAIAGIGAAVVDRNLVADLLSRDLLAEIAPDPPISGAEGHWFVALADRLRIRQVGQFRDWLVNQAAREPGLASPTAVTATAGLDAFYTLNLS